MPCDKCGVSLHGGLKYVVAACKHEFHIECMYKWQKEHATCPKCLIEVKPMDAREATEMLLECVLLLDKQLLELQRRVRAIDAKP